MKYMQKNDGEKVESQGTSPWFGTIVNPPKADIGRKAIKNKT